MLKKRNDDTIEAEEKSRGSDYSSVIININGLVTKSSNPTPSKPTIFEVDDRLRKVNPGDYEPKIVSIGPIHHGKEKLKSMEKHKVRLLQELLAEREDLSVEMLVNELRIVEDDASRCYSRSSDLSREKFLEILLLDGCFIIQLMRRYHSAKYRDTILESNTVIQIMHDLLLVENQLPFFVLTALFNMTKTGHPTDNLCRLILYSVGDIVPWLDDSMARLHPEPNHLLELVHGCILTKNPLEPNGRKVKISSAKAKKKKSVLGTHITSAFELQLIGIHLRRSKDSSLTFASKILRLPPLKISGETEALLRNLMAYEQLQQDYYHPRRVIDYVYFLQCLARSTGDVEILRYSGIINNFLGDDHMILQMLERLGTHFMRSPDLTYFDVFVSLNEFCSNIGWRANLMLTYFKATWSMIKAGSALLAFAITIAQLVFAVLSYLKEKRGARA